MKQSIFNLVCWWGFGMLTALLLPANALYYSTVSVALLVTSVLMMFTLHQHTTLIYLTAFFGGGVVSCLLAGRGELELIAFMLIVFLCYPGVYILCKPELKKAALRSVILLVWILFILTLPKPMVPGMLASSFLTMAAMQLAAYRINPFQLSMWKDYFHQKQEAARQRAHHHQIERQMAQKLNDLSRKLSEGSVSSYRKNVSA